MIWLRILAGVALLIVGRRLFWLFVGLIGFMWGIRAAAYFFPGQPEWMILAIALMAGLLGALLAIFLQWLAIGFAGFSVGAYIVLHMVHLSRWETGQASWILFLVGGVLGALLIIILFDWALIILSSLAGAGLITESLHVEQGSEMLIFIGLCVAGVLIQSRLMRMTRV